MIGIISATGDFASHAANLLRSTRNSGNPVVWIRGIAVECASVVSISNEGRCTFDELAVVRALLPEGEPQSTFRHAPDGSSWDSVCLWPDRIYREGEFKLAQPGLEEGASQLAGRSIAVSQWRGRIWFSAPALTNDQLLSFARDSRRSVPYLERMVEDYAGLVTRLSAGDSSSDIPFIFFSTLLPFHKSYGVVIREMLDDFPGVARQVADVALTNGVVSWLDGRIEFSTSTKVAGDPQWNGLFPPHMITSYVVDTEERVKLVAPRLPRAIARNLALIAVVKEFKMIISKNIYARYLPLARRSRGL